MKSYQVEDNLKLFNSYTNAYRQAGSTQYKDFSEYSPFSPQSVVEYVDDYVYSGNRSELCEILLSYSKMLGADNETLQNIELLKDKDTFAVITGHQPALFGGSLFLFLKIASVVSAVRELNSADSAYKFVPVFWNASEDHNAAEFASLSLYDSANDIRSISINLEQEKRMSSHIEGEMLTTVIDDLFAALPASEFTQSIKNDICAAKSDNLGLTFSALLKRWFEKDGLIIIEPEYLRRSAEPVIAAAFERHDELVQNMNEDSAEMAEAGFKPQLPYGTSENTFVFYVDNGVRYRIKRIDNSFKVEELNLQFSLEEILELLAIRPEKFSPSAALRPVVQAAVFPVVTYAAGGGELAYHYQLRKIFKTLGQSMPLMLPRISGSFITPSINKLLAKFSFTYDDIFNNTLDWDETEQRLIAANKGLQKLFKNYNDGFASENSRLSAGLTELGISNQNEFKREIEKFTKRLDMLEKRFAAENGFAGSGAKEKFYKMKKYLLPAGKYQELSISGLYFYSLLGGDFFNKIVDVDVFSQKHYIWIFE